jgi:hypothetical protein
MDPRWRIDGVIADRAAFSQGIHDGCVSIVGEHNSLRVSEKSWQIPGAHGKALDVYARQNVEKRQSERLVFP